MGDVGDISDPGEEERRKTASVCGGPWPTQEEEGASQPAHPRVWAKGISAGGCHFPVASSERKRGLQRGSPLSKMQSGCGGKAGPLASCVRGRFGPPQLSRHPQSRIFPLFPQGRRVEAKCNPSGRQSPPFDFHVPFLGSALNCLPMGETEQALPASPWGQRDSGAGAQGRKNPGPPPTPCSPGEARG